MALHADNPSPLYVQLKEHIRDEIAGGRLASGERLPTTKQMAGRYGVCHKTVQLAMRTLAREGLLIRRPHHGTYVASAPVERLRGHGGEQRVALLLQYADEEFMKGPFVRELISGVMGTASELGCTIEFSVYSTFDKVSFGGRLDACLLIRPSREEALRIKRLGMPTLLLDVAHPRTGLGCVQTDNASGIQQAVQHLVSLGHRRILYVHSDYIETRSFSGTERFHAFRAEAARCGLPLEDYTALGARLEERLAGPAFTAILTDGYQSTLNTLRTLHRKGIVFPDDVSLVAFDDVELAEYMPAPLTVVRQRLEEVGAEGLRLVLAAQGPTTGVRKFVKPELTIRASSAQASPAGFRYDHQR